MTRTFHISKYQQRDHLLAPIRPILSPQKLPKNPLVQFLLYPHNPITQLTFFNPFFQFLLYNPIQLAPPTHPLQTRPQAPTPFINPFLLPYHPQTQTDPHLSQPLAPAAERPTNLPYPTITPSSASHSILPPHGPPCPHASSPSKKHTKNHV